MLSTAAVFALVIWAVVTHTTSSRHNDSTLSSTLTTQSTPTTPQAAASTFNDNAVPTTLTPQIIATYPHDSTAFTQGLAFTSDGRLFESTGQYFHSDVRLVDVLDGTVEQRQLMPQQVFGEGLTIVNDLIYVLTWREDTCLIYDLSLRPLGSFSYEHEGWGLTFDGSYLIASDGSNQLYFYSLNNKLHPQLHHTLQVSMLDTTTKHYHPLMMLNELEFIDGLIYANVWMQNVIVAIEPLTGHVVKVLDLSDIAAQHISGDPDAVLNGIAYNPVNSKVYVTGKLWDKLYEIKLT